jgi:hypothetical protein
MVCETAQQHKSALTNRQISLTTGHSAEADDARTLTGDQRETTGITLPHLFRSDV